jgi:flagellar hook-associated protein 2
MTSPSSFNVSGLLGANTIDTSALVAQLMQAKAIPQTQLKNQLNVQQAITSAYQAINTRVTAMQTAAQALTDPTAWTATTASSSNAAVVATSTGSAKTGVTTFNVLQLAAAQVSVVAADGSGNVVTDPAAGINVGGVAITLTTGSATDVASAINSQQSAVRATVVNTDSGQVLQLASAKTGGANSFAATGFTTAAQIAVPPHDAQIGVGDPLNPLLASYTVSSSSNTFTDVIPGVTFSVSAVAANVSITVAPDAQSISDKVKALVAAANAAVQEIGADSGKGGILQGTLSVQTLQQAIPAAISRTSVGDIDLSPYGIDIDKAGVMSFNAAKFAVAFAADPTASKSAVAGSFATTLAATATGANAPITGSITQAIAAGNDQSANLTTQIDAWTERLATVQTTLQTKYANMQSMMAKLQSQSTWLTSMLKSMNSDSSSN